MREVERLVEEGRFSSKTEAFTEALRLLIRSYKAEELRKRIDRIRKGTERMPSVTKALAEMHEEERLRPRGSSIIVKWFRREVRGGDLKAEG